MLYKSLLISKIFFSKLYLKSVENKLTNVFFRNFVTKCTSRIWVFLAVRPRRKQPPVYDKIGKYLLSHYYHFSSNKLLLHF